MSSAEGSLREIRLVDVRSSTVATLVRNRRKPRLTHDMGAVEAAGAQLYAIRSQFRNFALFLFVGSIYSEFSSVAMVGSASFSRNSAFIYGGANLRTSDLKPVAPSQVIKQRLAWAFSASTCIFPPNGEFVRVSHEWEIFDGRAL